MLFAHATAKAPGTFLYLSGASSCVGGFLAGPSGYVCGSAFFCVLVRELSPAGVLKKNFFGKILKYFQKPNNIFPKQFVNCIDASINVKYNLNRKGDHQEERENQKRDKNTVKKQKTRQFFCFQAHKINQKLCCICK